MSGADAVLQGKAAGTVSRGRILRYSLMERINHWFGAVVYTYLLLTGLAFWSPYLFWLATVFGGGPSARFWHPWFGLLFFISMVWMYRDWHADMRITEADEEWKEKVRYYIRNEDEKLPPVGRFNWGQKAYFWVMLWATILLLLSGIGLWFVEAIPWSLRFLRYTAVIVHVGAALITIGAFIIHVYMGTAMVRGGFTSIVRGEVSTAWAKEHHRLWYEKVIGRNAAANR
jgi:formate dehydrogenase subunit gamma